MARVSEEIKARSEVYYGDELGREKTKELLREAELPNGLLPLEGILECGYDRESGFVWLKQKKKTDHLFEKIGKVVSYAPEVTAYVEKKKFKKVTGVKVKELLIWITLSDMHVDDPPTGNMTFKTPLGLSRSFPVTAFEIDEGKK